MLAMDWAPFSDNGIVGLVLGIIVLVITLVSAGVWRVARFAGPQVQQLVNGHLSFMAVQKENSNAMVSILQRGERRQIATSKLIVDLHREQFPAREFDDDRDCSDLDVSPYPQV